MLRAEVSDESKLQVSFILAALVSLPVCGWCWRMYRFPGCPRTVVSCAKAPKQVASGEASHAEGSTLIGGYNEALYLAQVLWCLDMRQVPAQVRQVPKGLAVHCKPQSFRGAGLSLCPQSSTFVLQARPLPWGASPCAPPKTRNDYLSQKFYFQKTRFPSDTKVSAG